MARGFRSGGVAAAASAERLIVLCRNIRCHQRTSGHGLRTGREPTRFTDTDGPPAGRPINRRTTERRVRGRRLRS
jgi:hypothetical protein